MSKPSATIVGYLAVVLCGLAVTFFMLATDPDFSLGALATRGFWIPFLGAMAVLIVVFAVILLVHSYTLRALHWFGGKFLAVAPAPLGAAAHWAARVARLFYGAILLCGVTAFGLSALIWHVQLSDSGDPTLRNPLFWLTWLGVMAGIMIAGIAGAVLLRYLVALSAIAHARLWKARDGS